MMTEAEKRLKRVCFTGHRPAKLHASEAAVKAALATEIKRAYDEGYRTFITGMAQGVDIWAGELVLQLRSKDSSVRLICALPFPGFGDSWSPEWRQRYHAVLTQADLTREISDHYSMATFQKRNEWMVEQADLVIAYVKYSWGGAAKTLECAKRKKVPIINISLKQQNILHK